MRAKFFRNEQPFDAFSMVQKLVLANTYDDRKSLIESVSNDDLKALSSEFKTQTEACTSRYKEALSCLNKIFNNQLSEDDICSASFRYTFRKRNQAGYQPKAEEYKIAPEHLNDFCLAAERILQYTELHHIYSECLTILLGRASHGLLIRQESLMDSCIIL